MAGLFAEVILLSLAAAISPVVLMVALALMSGSRPVFTSGFFALGVTLTTVVLFGLGSIAIHAERDGMTPGPLGSRFAHLLVGLMLIGAGIALAAMRPNPRRAQAFQDRFLSGSRGWHDYALAGVIVMITNASTFVVAIAIIHQIARGAAGHLTEAVIALVLATVITSLPGTAPFVAAAVGGDGMRQRLAAIGVLTTRYGRFVMAALWIAFGVRDVAAVAFG